jgi:pterin-4a-carbinolamine dehydratase
MALTARQFQDAQGTADWRALARGASALFRTGSAREGAELVARVATAADEADHHPDLDLRRDGVVARVFSHSDWALTEADLGLARTISAIAAELGLAADPHAVQEVDLTIDALDIPAVRPFWAAVLGHDPIGEDDLLDPHWRWPAVWFQQMDAPRPLRNRIHVDTFLPSGQRPARVDAALAAGGHVANDAFAPNWWTLADAEGNEVDVNDWEGFPYEVAPPRLTPAQFSSSGGVEDWAFLQGASALYRTRPGLAQGAALASAAAALADEAGLPVYVDLRWATATVRVAPPEDGWMDDRGLALCRGIQSAARDLGLTADPRALRDMHVVVDALDVPAVRDFWEAVLGYARRGDEDLYDPLLRGPSLVFQRMDEPREQRNRIHLDVFVPDDVAAARIEGALAAGGRLVGDAHAPFWWTLADPEGNEVDVAVSVGRAEARG